MNRIRVLMYYYGRMLKLLSFSSIIPFIFSIVLGERIDFIMLCGISPLILYLVSIFLEKHSIIGEIKLVEAYVLTALTFLTAGIIASIPIMVYDNPLNALFEGVSAITTTGLSSLNEEALTNGVHFLRSFYQWIGGLGIALLTLTVLIQPGTTAYNIYVAHMGKYKPKPLSLSAIKLILEIYIALTMIFFIFYLVSGQELFTALINSLTTISTGGFSTLNYFRGTSLYTGLIFMFISAQPIVLYYYIFKGRGIRGFIDVQVLSFTVIVVLASILLYIASNIDYIYALFQVVSALSTTGYTSLDNSMLNDTGKLVLSILMIIGAGLGSTGGGLKQLRIVLIFKSIINELKKPFLPRKAVVNVKIGGHYVSNDEILWSFILLVVYLFALIMSVTVFTLYNHNFVDSLFETSSALATTGLSVGLSGPNLENPLKIVLIIDMLLGRVEIIPYIYLIIYPWRLRE